MRVTLNLVDAVKLVQLGARTIDITAGRGVMTQDTVADAATALLALKLESRLGGSDDGRVLRRRTRVSLYVTKNDYVHRSRNRGVKNINQAVETLGRALAIDPRYASAHTALAEAYWRKYESGSRTGARSTGQ